MTLKTLQLLFQYDYDQIFLIKYLNLFLDEKQGIGTAKISNNIITYLYHSSKIYKSKYIITYKLLTCSKPPKISVVSIAELTAIDFSRCPVICANTRTTLLFPHPDPPT